MKSSLFEPGVNCWKVANAKRATVLIDAENYFRAVRQSMAKADERIMLLGWDFDARIKMYDTQGSHEGPLEIGRYINWLLKRNSKLHVYILRWDIGAIKAIFRGKTIFTIMRWMMHPRVHLKLDNKHPIGAAQHQKVIVIDNDTAFCGGIDITDDRWDTRAHHESQSEREQPNGKDAGPWHDAAMIVQGDIATVLSEFSEDRWYLAGGKQLLEINNGANCWPDKLAADFDYLRMAVSRTRPEMDGEEGIFEIEKLYCDLIGSAKYYIYAESQYFASNKIAAALVARLEEPDGPEIVIINPVSAEGWLESEIMDTTRARLVEAIHKRDKYDRFRFYHPINDAGTDIYVHSKIVIIDDRIIRIGSSNLNNRSMGFDSECDIWLDANDFDDPRANERVAEIRNSLIAEHLGCEIEHVEQNMKKTGSLTQTIQLLDGPGRTLKVYQQPDLNVVEKWLAENDVLDPDRADSDYPSIR